MADQRTTADQRSLNLFFTRGVALTTWERVGSLERELAIYRALAARGWRVRFITYGDESDHLPQLAQSGIEIMPVGNRPGPTVASLLAPLRARKQRAAIYKSNQIEGAWSAIIAGRLARAAVIVRCGYLWSTIRDNSSASRLRKWWTRQLEGLCFRLADRCVVTTPLIRDRIITLHRVNPARVSVIPNYVETEVFKPNAQIPREPGLVGFVGRLSPEKNLPELFHALSGISGARLLCIGNGPPPYREMLEKLAVDLGLYVQFVPAIPNHELPGQLNRCQVFALPSLYEGHPKALIEAMSCGLAVAGADSVGISDVIEHERNGLLCAPQREAIAATLSRLLTDADLRQRLGAQARNDICERYSLERVVELELELYERLTAYRGTGVHTDA